MIPIFKWLTAAAFAASLTAGAQASELRCIGADSGSASEQGLDLTFDSWREVPATGGTLFKFGRCIQTENRQYFFANWWPSGLSGTVEYGRPLRAVLPFPSEKISNIESTLFFGIRHFWENSLNTNLISSTIEKLDGKKIEEDPELRALIKKALYKELGKEAAEEMGTLQSVAQVGIFHEKFESPIYVQFEVRSYLPSPDGTTLHGGSYNIRAEVISGASKEDAASAFREARARLKPTSIFQIVNLFNNDEEIYLDRLMEEGGLTLKYPSIEIRDFYLERTVYNIVLNNGEGASFPAVVYTNSAYQIN